MKKIGIAIAVIIVLLTGTMFLIMKPDKPLAELKLKYTTADSKFIDVEGLQVHYRIEGSGSPIVLIHGTGACLQTWDAWTDSLKSTHKVIRLDMPGFGLTGPRADRDYSIAMYVRFLHEFMSKIGIDSFALGGNSLGGQIAWNYALVYPQQVSSLILVDPGGFYKDGKAGALVFKLAKIKWLADIMKKMDSKIMVNKTLKDVYYDDSKITGATKQLYYDMSMREGNRQAFVDRVQLIATDSSKDLRAIQCPTLVLWGKEDVLIDVAMADSFAVIPHSKVIKYKEVGHSAQEEIPGQSVYDVEEFLQENETESAFQTITRALYNAAKVSVHVLESVAKIGEKKDTAKSK
jgi:pimeloyl-ACP methyl ester carboxylesterase